MLGERVPHAVGRAWRDPGADCRRPARIASQYQFVDPGARL